MTNRIAQLLKYKAVIWTTLIITLLFYTATQFTNFFQLNAIARSIVLWISVAVLIVYGRFAFSAASSSDLTDEDKLILGITFNWIGAFGTCVLVVFWRFAHPGMPLVTDWITYLLLIQAIGGIYHVIAYRSILNRYIPMYWVITSVIAGGIVTGGTILAGIGWG